MQKIYLVIACLLLAHPFAGAQTWNGNTNSNWNLGTNWSSGNVPTPSDNVIIPGSGITNWPKLSSSVSINNFSMQVGSRIDVNGFSMTMNGELNFNNAVINNSDAGSNIVFNFNGAQPSYVSGTTFNDAVLINHNATSALYEGYTQANLFNGDLTVNASAGPVLISTFQPSVYTGNVAIARTVSGNTEMFTSGGTCAGNFSYVNNAGGACRIGSDGSVTTIGGKIDIGLNPAADVQYMVIKKMKNNGAGGVINIQKASFIQLYDDTLNVVSFTAAGLKNGTTNDFNRNKITGAVTIADDAATASLIYFRNMQISGNTIFNLSGAGQFYESYQGPNIFNGNVNYNITGGIDFFHHYEFYPNAAISGNLVINRTGAGNTRIFGAGGNLTGNLSYTNNAGGATYIGNPGRKTAIGGALTLNSDFGSASPQYYMERVINQGTGNINIENAGYIQFYRDTIKSATFNVTNLKYITTSDVNGNEITSNVYIADNPTSGSYLYFRNNRIIGNLVFDRNGPNPIYEAYQGANNVTGNTTYNLASTADAFLGYESRSIYQGNVTINRTVAGNTYAFNSVGASIAGNFSYNNNAGGNTSFGIASRTTNIAGKLLITSNFSTGAPALSFTRLKNDLAAGSKISIQNPGNVFIGADTLKLDSLNLLNIKSLGVTDLQDNDISGTVNITDDPMLSNTLYTRRNTFNGDVIITRNGTGNFYETYQGSNLYNGNLTLNRPGPGLLYISYDDTARFSQNLNINANGGIDFGSRMKFVGSGNSAISQAGTQSIIFNGLTMQKTGSGKLILNTPLTVRDSIAFKGGNIQSSNSNPFNFMDNTRHSGGTVSSHIIGTVSKTGDDAFVFPVGGDNGINPVAMTAPGLATDKFTVQYFKVNPNDNGYDTAARVAALKRISSCEYWLLNRDAGTSDVSLTFSFTNPCAGNNYVTDPSKLRIARWSGSVWQDLGNTAATGTTTGSIRTSAPVTAFGPFTFGTTDALANPLPLKLVSFAAQKRNDQTLLDWKTDIELNFSHFEIEKSNDASNFTKIGSVAALNTQTRNSYDFTDAFPFKGINYYRLKLVDKDGAYSFSAVVKLDFSKALSFTIAPNPAQNFIILKDAALLSLLKISDAQGRLIIQRKITRQQEQVDISELPAGIYLLQVISGQKIESTSFIKQ